MDKVATNMVVLRPNDKAVSIGTLTGGTDWYGIVRFHWDATDMLYRSESFEVTLKKVIEVQANVVNIGARALLVRFPTIETTRAEHGYCFLMASAINNSQAIKSATATNAFQFRPRIPIEVLDATQNVDSTFYWEMDCAYRIMVGGDFAFPGPCMDQTRSNYFQRIRRTTPAQLATWYQTIYGAKLTTAGAGAWITATLLHPGNNLNLYGDFFQMMNLQEYDDGAYAGFPVVQPRNSQTGAAWEGYTVAPTPTPCMGPTVLADITDPATDYTRGQQLIAKALLAMAAGQLYDANSRWPVSANLPVQIVLEQSAANYNFIEDSVRPTKFQGSDAGSLLDPDSFWTWKKIYLPLIVFRADAYNEWEQMVLDDGGNANNEDDWDYVPAADQVPLVETFFQAVPGFSGYKELFVSGTAMDSAVFNDAATFAEKLIMVPAVFEYYQNENFFPITYTRVNDPDGAESFEESFLTAAPTSVSKRFYIVGDVEADVVAHRFGIKAYVQPIFDTKKMYTFEEDEDIDLHVVNVRLPEDRRLLDEANRTIFKDGFAVGNIFECVNHVAGEHDDADRSVPLYPDHRLPVVYDVRESEKYEGTNELWIQNLFFSFPDNRTFFLGTNNIGGRDVLDTLDSGFYFHTRDCRTVIMTHADNVVVVTVVERLYKNDGTESDLIYFEDKDELANNQHDLLALCHLGKSFQDTWFGDPAEGTQAVTIFDDKIAESNLLGPVFQSKKRISQHLCAPVLNPNMRIGCTAPLNFETGHLPPELRDFRLAMWTLASCRAR